MHTEGGGGAGGGRRGGEEGRRPPRRRADDGADPVSQSFFSRSLYSPVRRRPQAAAVADHDDARPLGPQPLSENKEATRLRRGGDATHPPQS